MYYALCLRHIRTEEDGISREQRTNNYMYDVWVLFRNRARYNFTTQQTTHPSHLFFSNQPPPPPRSPVSTYHTTIAPSAFCIHPEKHSSKQLLSEFGLAKRNALLVRRLSLRQISRLALLLRVVVVVLLFCCCVAWCAHFAL